MVSIKLQPLQQAIHPIPLHHQTITRISSRWNVSSSSSSATVKPSRCIVTILTTAFFLVTILIPVLRFVRYDDSHLFESMVLIQQQQQQKQQLQHIVGNSSHQHGSAVSPTSTNAGTDGTSTVAITRGNSISQKNNLDKESIDDENEIEEDTETEERLEVEDVQDAGVIGEELDNEEEENEEGGEDGVYVHQSKLNIALPETFVWDDEVRIAMNYIQSFPNVGRVIPTNIESLLFFHVPKTAGTAIEYAAGTAIKVTKPTKPKKRKKRLPEQQLLSWGSCRFDHTPKRDICNYPKNSKPWPQSVGWWHIPAQLFPIANSNPYKNAELFGVIRDPYDRMVSEFYYICTLKVFDWRPDQCDRTKLTDVNYMNEWLTKKISNRETDSGRSYLIDNGHFTPQHDFIFGPNHVRMLDYVLLMDSPNFNSDFDVLMAAYQLSNVKLKKLNALGASSRNEQHFDTQHLDRSTIQWIHTMYPDDFSLGGYSKKS